MSRTVAVRGRGGRRRDGARSGRAWAPRCQARGKCRAGEEEGGPVVSVQEAFLGRKDEQNYRLVLGRRKKYGNVRVIAKGLLEEEVGLFGGMPEAQTLTPVESKELRKTYSPAPCTWPNTS